MKPIFVIVGLVNNLANTFFHKKERQDKEKRKTSISSLYRDKNIYLILKLKYFLYKTFKKIRVKGDFLYVEKCDDSLTLKIEKSYQKKRSP